MPQALCNNHIKFVSQFYINVTSLKKMLITDLCSFDSHLFFFMTNYKSVPCRTGKLKITKLSFCFTICEKTSETNS